MGRYTWSYDEEAISTIKAKIDGFYKEYNNLQKIEIRRVTSFHRVDSFKPLAETVNKMQNLKNPNERITERWLYDLYNGNKNFRNSKRIRFDSMCIFFNLQYDYVSNEVKDLTTLKNPEEIKDPFLVSKLEIISLIKAKSKKREKILSLFVGKYNYFIGGRTEGSKYDYIYQNELEITLDGNVIIKNPFNKNIYFGLALIKNEKCLQIISLDYFDGLIEGVGNAMSFIINLYGRDVLLIPGISLSFNADLIPISAQALLCSNLNLNKESALVREYFNNIKLSLRLYCPDTIAVEKLVLKYFP